MENCEWRITERMHLRRIHLHNKSEQLQTIEEDDTYKVKNVVIRIGVSVWAVLFMINSWNSCIYVC